MRIALLFMLLAFSANLYSQNQWTYIGDIKDGYGFWNATTYAYLENFQLKFTSDGGNSSVTSSLAPGLLSPVVACHYLNENTIFLVQRDLNDLYFHKSTDGGENFTDLGQITVLQGYTYNALFNIHFFDEMNGFLLIRTLFQGDVTDVLIKTGDGGTNWDFATTTSMSDGAKDIVFTGTNNVRIFSDGNGIFESTDFGANWTNLGSNPLNVTGVFAGHGDLIWGVGDNGANQPCNVISNDGGATFTDWNIPDFANGGFDDCGERLAAASATSMVVSGHEDGFSNEVTLYSTDGGQTFSEITFPDTEDHSAENVLLADDGLTYLYRSFTDTYAFGPGGMNTSSTDKADQLAKSVTLYPNPSSTGIVHLSEPQENVSVYNYLGELVFTSGKKTSILDLSNLVHGLYIIQLEHQTKRLIIQ